MKNILVAVALISLVGAGIYIFTMRDATQLMLSQDGAVSAEVLANTQLFMVRSAILDSLDIETAVLRDARLTSLRSYTTDVPERPVGRPNPFEPAAQSDQ